MNLILCKTGCDIYKSESQRSRVVSEAWAEKNAFCCNCGGNLIKTQSNCPVLDFTCRNCAAGFELKSARGALSRKVPDGSYQSMMNRLNDTNSPTFFFMTYNPSLYNVTNFFAVPVFFLDTTTIEKRKPLGPSARRAGWTGCNIILDRVPEMGKVYYVKNGEISDKSTVLKSWQQTTFLKKEKNLEARGWLLSVLRAIQSLKSKEFVLAQLYALEPQLRFLYPHNHFIKEKIRQQLQVLRDEGLVVFEGRGRYRIID